MAWSATLIDIGLRDKRIALSILFTDNKSEKFIREYVTDRGDVEHIRQLAMGEIARILISDTEKNKLAPLGPIDISPNIPPDPDPILIAKESFLNRWHLLQSYHRARTVGLIASDDPAINDLQIGLMKDFLPAYLEAM